MTAKPCSADCLVHDEHIYILCFGEPTSIKSQDGLPADPSRGYPITHYVGYTTQRPPMKRIKQHGVRCAEHIAQVRPGSQHDEIWTKMATTCPACGQSLWYYNESPTYALEYVPPRIREFFEMQQRANDELGF